MFVDSKLGKALKIILSKIEFKPGMKLKHGDIILEADSGPALHFLLRSFEVEVRKSWE